MTNDLTALKKKHAELGEEIARLEKQPAPGDNPWGIFLPKETETYSIISQSRLGGIFADSGHRASGDADSLVFRTEGVAQRFAEVFQVIIGLRAPGLGSIAHPIYAEDTLYVVDADMCAETGKITLFINEIESDEHAVGATSPIFPTKEAAKHAIDTVGESRIIAAFRTLAGLEA